MTQKVQANLHRYVPVVWLSAEAEMKMHFTKPSKKHRTILREKTV